MSKIQKVEELTPLIAGMLERLQDKKENEYRKGVREVIEGLTQVIDSQGSLLLSIAIKKTK